MTFENVAFFRALRSKTARGTIFTGHNLLEWMTDEEEGPTFLEQR
jgi:hypothetical protein